MLKKMSECRDYKSGDLLETLRPTICLKQNKEPWVFDVCDGKLFSIEKGEFLLLFEIEEDADKTLRFLCIHPVHGKIIVSFADFIDSTSFLRSKEMAE